MDEMMRMCGTCAAFGPQIDHDQDIESDEDGACRLNPPFVACFEDGCSMILPCVNREDWCLQWRPRSEA